MANSRHQNARPDASRRRVYLSGAGSLSIGGTNRVNQMLKYVLTTNPWETDAKAIHSDFDRAMKRAAS